MIVPVYQTEKYLEKCLDSLRMQTYTDFEALLVDDGSPDGSGALCEEYARRDARFRVFHKENGGLSDARNAGLRQARGELITFVDSDDWVDPELLRVLLEGIQAGAGISCCGFYTVRNGDPKPWREPTSGYVLLDAEAAVRDMMYGHSIDTSVWGKLFHRSCFNTLSFPMGRLYEEVALTYRLMLTQKTVAITTQPLYYYVKRADSIVTGAYTPAQKDMLRASREMLRFAEEERPALIPAARRRVVYACFYLLKTMGREYRQFPEDVEEITALFEQYKDAVFADPEVSRRDKAAILLLSRGVPLFETTWGLYSGLTGRHGNA